METMELTEDERKLVLIYRQAEKETEVKLELRKKILKIAYEFETWKQYHKVDQTFSTFINDFNYQDDNGKLIYTYLDEINKLLPA